MNNIIEFIDDNFKSIKKIDILEFCQELNKFFAEELKTSPCPIEFKEKLNDNMRTAPASFGYYTNKEKTSYKPVISMTNRVVDEKNLARIIKLFSHEWGHYYEFLVNHDMIDGSTVDKKYLELMLEAKNDYYNYNSDNKYECAKQKLSPREKVADLFAQDFLKEIIEKITNKKLKKLIKEQIVNHDTQIKYCEDTIANDGLSC